MSPSMSAPELPGFYFDEEKKKYFRIVNGDQRLNTPYSNNAVRAKERRERYKSNSAKKRKTRGRDTDVANGVLSRNQDIATHSTDMRAQFLRLRLALLAPENIFHHILSDYSELLSVRPYSIWSGFDENTCFTLEGSILKLFYAKANGSKPSHTHSLFPYLEVEPSVDNQSSDVACLDHWVFVQFGKLFSVTSWTPTDNDKYTVTDHTRQIMLDISGAYTLQNAEPPVLEGVFGTLQKVGSHAYLELLLTTGDLVVYNLNHGRVVDIKLLLHHRRDLEIGGLRIWNDIWCFYTNKLLTLVDRKSLKTRKFLFDSQIFHHELTVSTPPIAGLKPILNLVIVTQKNVILRHLGVPAFKCMSEDQIVAIHNDNQSHPLIYKSGDYVLVEELPDEFKIINFALGITEQKSIAHTPLVIRDGKPRLVPFGGDLYWSDSKKCFQYS